MHVVKTIHDKILGNHNSIQLPHELEHVLNVCTKYSLILCPQEVQGRTFKYEVALELIAQNMLVTLQAQALSLGNSGMATLILGRS